jgi:hypothetical protein
MLRTWNSELITLAKDDVTGSDFVVLTHFLWILTYAGSFIIRYVERIVYVELSCHFIFVFTFILFGLNMWF